MSSNVQRWVPTLLRYPRSRKVACSLSTSRQASTISGQAEEAAAPADSGSTEDKSVIKESSTAQAGSSDLAGLQSSGQDEGEWADLLKDKLRSSSTKPPARTSDDAGQAEVSRNLLAAKQTTRDSEIAGRADPRPARSSSYGLERSGRDRTAELTRRPKWEDKPTRSRPTAHDSQIKQERRPPRDRSTLAPSELKVFTEILSTKAETKIGGTGAASDSDNGAVITESLKDILDSLFPSESPEPVRPVERTIPTSRITPPDTSMGSFSEITHIPKATSRLSDVRPEADAIFDRLKEDISKIPTDADILAWADTNIFGKMKELSESGMISDSGFSDVYPLILSHLISLFRDRFGDPHTAVYLFEYAKNLGPESFLYGCSTSAYNEMLQTRWTAFNDLKSVEAGVQEMRVNGVGWDKTTSRLIGSIVEELGKRRFEGGDPVKAEQELEKEFGKGVGARIAALERSVEEQIDVEENKARATAVRRNGGEREGGSFGGHRLSIPRAPSQVSTARLVHTRPYFSTQGNLLSQRLIRSEASSAARSPSSSNSRSASSLVPPASTTTRLDSSTASLLDDMDMGIGMGEGTGSGGPTNARERRREARMRRLEEMDAQREDAEVVAEDREDFGARTGPDGFSVKRLAGSSTSTAGHRDPNTTNHSTKPGPRSDDVSHHESMDADSDDHFTARDPRGSSASLFGRKRVGMMVLPEAMKRAIREEVAEQPSAAPLRNLYLSSLPHLTSTRRSTSQATSNSSKSSKSAQSQAKQTRDKDPVTPLSALLRAVVDLPGEYSAVRNVLEELKVRLGEVEFHRLGLGPTSAAADGEALEAHSVGGGVVIWDGGMGSGVWSLLGLPMEDDGAGVEGGLKEIDGKVEGPNNGDGLQVPAEQTDLDGSPVEYIHASRHMLDMSSRLLSVATEPRARPIDYNRQYKSSASAYTDASPSVAISTFHLSKLPTHRARATRIQEMLNTGAEMLVFVEEGTTMGYKAVLEAREHALHAEPESAGKAMRRAGKSKGRKERAYVSKGEAEDAEVDEEEDVIEIAGEKYYPVKASRNKGLQAEANETEDVSEVLGYHVVAPCPHDKPCPLAASGSRDICSFSQRVQAPDFLRRTKHSSRGETDFRYTYVVLRRGKRPEPTLQVPLGIDRGIKQGREGAIAIEEKQRARQRDQADERGEIVEVLNAADGSFEVMRPVESDVEAGTGVVPDLNMEELRMEAYGWPRLIVPPIKRSGHVILDTCHSSGSIVRLTVPRSQSKQAFYDARKSSWGDIFPHDSKGAEVVRTRGVRNLKKVEGEVWDEGEDAELEGSVDWPVAELVDVDGEVQEDEVVRTFG